MKAKQVMIIGVIVAFASCNESAKPEPVIVDCMPVFAPPIIDSGSTLITPNVGDSNVVDPGTLQPN